MKTQSRDKRLMELLYRYGVLTTGQIRRLCFENVAHTTVLRRLRKLESADVILRLNGLEDGLLCWCLTKNGTEAVGLDHPAEYRNRNILRHTTLLADVRLALKGIGLGQNWTSEVEMRREMYDPKNLRGKDKLVPDGIFPADVFGKTQMVALELEINLKSRSRYGELFRQYAGKSAIGLVWYVVDSAPLGESLRKIWQATEKYSRSPDLRISLLSDLLSDPRRAKMFDSVKSVTVAELFGLKVLNPPAQIGAQGLSKENGKSESSIVDEKSAKYQGDADAHATPAILPSTVDHSPSTLVSREWSTVTGKREEVA